MAELTEDLAALVADTLALADAVRGTAGWVVPVGPLALLPPAEPWGPLPSRPGPAVRTAPAPDFGRPASAPDFGRPAAPVARPPGPAVAPRPPAPSPTLARAPSGPPAPRADPRPVEPPVPRDLPLRSSDPAPAAAAGGGLAGLFGGRWEQALRDPAEEVARVLAEAPPCPGCGARGTSLAGKGSARARLVVLAADPAGIGLVGASGAMLDNMLVKVLALERSDVYVIEANACAVAGRTGTCRDLLLRQVDLVAPGVVLSMGADLLPGLRSPRGEWSSHGAIDVMPTFHPTELVTRPADKRAALEHLTALRKRL